MQRVAAALVALAAICVLSPSSSVATEPLPVFLSPTKYTFMSKHGLDIEYVLTNRDPGRLEVVPGDYLQVQVTARVVDPTAMEWPTVLDIDADVLRFYGEHKVTSLKIKSHGFKGFEVGYLLGCRSDDSAFRGISVEAGWLNLDWRSVTTSRTFTGRITRPCDDVELTPKVGAVIRDVVLEGQSAPLPYELENWFGLSEFDDVPLGSLRYKLNLLRWQPIKNATVGMKSVLFQPRVLAGTVLVTTSTKRVCEVSGRKIKLLNPGKCTVRMTVDNMQGYLPVSQETYSFTVRK